MYRKQKTCLGSCFLRLMFLLRSLFLVLIELSLFKILLNVYRALSRVHSGMFLSYSKKRKNSQNGHSLSLDVTFVCLFINDLKSCIWIKDLFSHFHTFRNGSLRGRRVLSREHKLLKAISVIVLNQPLFF